MKRDQEAEESWNSGDEEHKRFDQICFPVLMERIKKFSWMCQSNKRVEPTRW